MYISTVPDGILYMVQSTGILLKVGDVALRVRARRIVAVLRAPHEASVVQGELDLAPEIVHVDPRVLRGKAGASRAQPHTITMLHVGMSDLKKVPPRRRSRSITLITAKRGQLSVTRTRAARRAAQLYQPGRNTEKPGNGLNGYICVF